MFDVLLLFVFGLLGVSVWGCCVCCLEWLVCLWCLVVILTWRLVLSAVLVSYLVIAVWALGLVMVVLAVLVWCCVVVERFVVVCLWL